MKSLIIGIILFFLTLFTSLKSMSMTIPFWVPPISIVFCLALWIQNRFNSGRVWYVLAVWNCVIWWLGTLLYSDWGNGDWDFLFVKAPVLTMLIMNIPVAFIYYRTTQAMPSSRQGYKGLEWLQKLLGVQKKEENNAIDFILGEEVEANHAPMGRR